MIALAIVATVFAFWVVTSILYTIAEEDVFYGMMSGAVATLVVGVVVAIILGVAYIWNVALP